MLPVVLGTLLLPDLYIYFTYLRKRRRRPWALFLFALPSALLLVASLWLSINETLSPQNMDQLAAFFLVYMLFALPKTAFMLCSLLGRAVALLLPGAGTPATVFSVTVAVVLLAVMAYGSFFGPTRLQVRRVEFRSPDLPPAFDGYRIVQLSDLHLISQQGHADFVREVVQAVAAERPDMVVFTGDLVSIDSREVQGFEEALSQLSAPDGVYSILGNHDYLTYARYLSKREQVEHLNDLKERQRALGWDLLLNEHRIIRRGADSLALVGVENYGRPPFPQRGDLKKALKGLPDRTGAEASAPRLFKVLLSHDPTHWREKVLPETDIQLTLSGHTHGMQFMLFGWSPSRYVYPEWRGLYSEGGRALYVSLGLGGALVPFRFGAWPEINVVTLRRE